MTAIRKRSLLKKAKKTAKNRTETKPAFGTLSRADSDACSLFACVFPKAEWLFTQKAHGLPKH